MALLTGGTSPTPTAAQVGAIPATALTLKGQLLTQSADGTYAALAVGGAATLLGVTSGVPAWAAFAHTLSAPSNPGGTTSSTLVMMGLAGTITPTYSGKVRITIDGTLVNSSGSGAVKYAIATGTGTAPTNGAAATGTVVGATPQVSETVGTAAIPFSITRTYTGLALATALWIDLQLAIVVAGTATVTSLTIVADEMP